MRGVQIDEPETSASKQWNEDLDEFVRQLTSPKFSINIHSQSLDREPKSSATFKCDDILVSSANISKEMREQCALLPSDQAKEKTETKSWHRKIMDRKGYRNKYGSCDTDEGVEVSIDSTSSSSGLKDNKVVFTCDSSPETSDLDFNSETKLTEATTVYSKKDKESRRRRFKRMITRPLRRSKSDCCDKDIPVHAMFIDSERRKDNDTMESRASDLLLYHERLMGTCDRPDRIEKRQVHQTYSADAAMMANSSDLNTNPQTKPKPKHLAFKNMKRKFQFLRRRNTDTALVPNCSLPIHFTIPTYEQALQWSRSFDSLLNDKSGLELFKGFLKSEFSEENLEFWIACEDYRCSSEASMAIIGQKIHSDFVAFHAPKQVNLDSNTRMTTVANLDNPAKDTFSLAQHKIQALMEKDSYPRFIESELYQEILRSVSKV